MATHVDRVLRELRILGLMKLSVFASGFQQFVMAPGLDDLSFFDHKDPIGMPNGREAVSDYKTGSIFQHPFYSLLEEPFRTGIYACGSFIKDKYSGIVQKRTGKGQQLPGDVFCMS